jgi:hypothetical protein
MAKKTQGTGQTIGLMLMLGLLLGWAAIWAIPYAVRLGMPQRLADQLPYGACALGLSWGFATRNLREARSLLAAAAAPLLMGAVFWFIALFIAAGLMAAGLPPVTGDVVPGAGFLIGVLLGTLGGVAEVVSLLRPRPPKR